MWKARTGVTERTLATKKIDCIAVSLYAWAYMAPSGATAAPSGGGGRKASSKGSTEVASGRRTIVFVLGGLLTVLATVGATRMASQALAANRPEGQSTSS